MHNDIYTDDNKKQHPNGAVFVYMYYFIPTNDKIARTIPTTS